MGEAGGEGANAETAKAQYGSAARAYAAVSPRQSVTRADPVPAGEASLHPDSLLRGGCGAQRRRSHRVVEGERGCHALAPEIRLHSWFSALPRGCSSPRRPRNQADYPSRGRPPRVCSPHDVRPSGQWRGVMVRGVPGRTMDAGGDMCPQLGPGAAIVPSPARWFGSARPERAPTRPAIAGGPRSQGWFRGLSGSVCKARARAPVVARGDLVRDGTAGPRTPPGSARRAGPPGTRVRGRAGSAELSAPPPPARRSASSRISAPESSEGGCERAGPALGRCEDHRPALCQWPRPWQRRDIHLAWQLLPRGGGGARPPPYRRVAAGEARSGGGDGNPLRRAAGPFSIPGGPGPGAAGGSGPISILIAGLGGPIWTEA